MAFNYWQELEEGCVYHLYNRSVSEVKLFIDVNDYKVFLERFNKYFGHYLHVYSYCLIPNHFHFIVKVKEQSSFDTMIKKEKTKAAKKLIIAEIGINEFLEDQFRRMFSSFALSIKNKYNRQGALFQRRMKRVQVSENSQLVYLVNYVHHNPIHHGLCMRMIDWPFSSYHKFIGRRMNEFQRQYIAWLGDGDFECGMNVFQKSLDEFKLDDKSVEGLEEY